MQPLEQAHDGVVTEALLGDVQALFLHHLFPEGAHLLDHLLAPADLAQRWRRDARFDPAMKEAERTRRYDGWQDAVRRTRSDT